MIKLKAEIFSKVTDGLDGLKIALQSAIELEHSTLPPYLYALYSIKSGTNQGMASIIHSVVLEEMLHLALCCNLLNSIGGEPSLNRPDFIPSYPGPLPGAISEVEVPLAPISKSLLHDIFMKIEEPEDPLNFPVASFESMVPQTIGQFYGAIKDQFSLLAANKDIFIGNPSRQVITGLAGLRRVTDLQSAIETINLIVEQGEGTTTSPLAATEKPAHYYLFASAYYGKELVAREGDPPFAYAGNEILFDSSNIIPLVTNPTPGQYAGDAAIANEKFNNTYTELLEVLHKTFNGSPIRILSAISLMVRLKHEAIALTEIELENGFFAGPTFTYIPKRKSFK